MAEVPGFLTLNIFLLIFWVMELVALLSFLFVCLFVCLFVFLFFVEKKKRIAPNFDVFYLVGMNTAYCE